MTDKPRRAIALEGTGLPDLEISRVTALRSDAGVPGRIYLEQLDDGTWRLTYTQATLPDIAQLQALRLVGMGQPWRLPASDIRVGDEVGWVDRSKPGPGGLFANEIRDGFARLEDGSWHPLESLRLISRRVEEP